MRDLKMIDGISKIKDVVKHYCHSEMISSKKRDMFNVLCCFDSFVGTTQRSTMRFLILRCLGLYLEKVSQAMQGLCSFAAGIC